MLNDKIYYCNITGQVLEEIYDRVCQSETTFEEDYKMYNNLNQRTKETISLKELPFGEYVKLKKNYNVAKVNLDTLEFEFSYVEVPPAPNWNDEIDNKISILEEKQSTQSTEISTINSEQLNQDSYIRATQDAVDFLMLQNTPGTLSTRSVGVMNVVGNGMAMYIAIRVKEKGKESELAGQNYYKTFLTHQNYSQFKTDVDAILIAEGLENLIHPDMR